MTIVRKEFIQIIRDPQTLGLVIVMPVMMLFLLGYAVTNDVQNIPMAVVDLSKTDTSRAFIQRFPDSGYFVYAYDVQSESEIMKLIDSGAAKAGLIIPPDFGKTMDSGGSAAVQFYIDASNPTLAQTAQLAVTTISQAAAQDVLVQRLSQAGPTALALPIDARVRYLFNPDMRAMNFMIPALIAAILQVQTLLLTAFAIVREREQGTFEQLIVTPVRSTELILGKILPNIVIAVVNVAMAVAVGQFWFHVPISGNIWLLFGLSLVFLLSSLGLGLLISTVARTQMQAIYLATFVMLPTFLLSGFLFPRENMPVLAYYAGYLLPVTYFLEIVRGIILKGLTMVDLWQWVWPMAVFGIAVFTASVLLFRKRID
jgi:ABC-2 type transport system permease protein